MKPRPKSRRKPINVPEPEDLASDIAELRASLIEPVAIIAGFREWVVMKRNPVIREFLTTWPGLEETFCDIAVIVRRPFEGVRLIEDQAALEDILLGEPA